MVLIGWAMLLLVLTIGLRLGGVSLGLLSGLALGCLMFQIYPAPPPHHLMLLQTTWLLLMATLEATGFFCFLETKWIAWLEQPNRRNRLWTALFCYGYVFITGDKNWLYRSLCHEKDLNTAQENLILTLQIGAHMALLVSPLSISGIVLIMVAANNQLAILNLIGIIGCMTIFITIVTGLLVPYISRKWVTRKWVRHLSIGDNANYKSQVTPLSTNKMQAIFVLLLLTSLLFLIVQPTHNKCTEFICLDKIFPVPFAMFFALVILAGAALTMLYTNIKPIAIVQTYRFKSGIEQSFLFLGLTWLLNTLVDNNKAYLIEALSGINHGYGFYILAALSMLCIELPILMWIFMPLCIVANYNIVKLSAWVVLIHSLAPVSYWIKEVVQGYRENK